MSSSYQLMIDAIAQCGPSKTTASSCFLLHFHKGNHKPFYSKPLILLQYFEFYNLKKILKVYLSKIS